MTIYYSIRKCIYATWLRKGTILNIVLNSATNFYLLTLFFLLLYHRLKIVIACLEHFIFKLPLYCSNQLCLNDGI